MAIDPNSLPRDSETLRKIVVDLAEQLDRSLVEQNKYQSLLRELLEAQRSRKSEQLSKEQLALFETAWQARNVESAAEYTARIESGAKPESESTPAIPAEERYFVGLRLSEGVEPTPAEWIQLAEPLNRFIAEGLLERAGSRIRLTPRGVLLSNEVFAEFINL